MLPNLAMFLLKKLHVQRPRRLLLLPKIKLLRIGVHFSQIFDSGSGSDKKTQNPAGVNSGSVATFVHEPLSQGSAVCGSGAASNSLSLDPVKWLSGFYKLWN